MTEYRMLGPDECPDHRLGDEISINGCWRDTVMDGGIQVKNCACAYRRPIKQEEKPVTEFKVGDTVKIARKVVPDGWSDVWVGEMDAAVGQVGVIEYIGHDRYSLNVGKVGGYNYPKEALELVTSNDEPTDEPVVKEPSPQVYDWVAYSDGFFHLSAATEQEAFEWLKDTAEEDAESQEADEFTMTLFKAHTTATIKKTVEISVKSVDATE